MGHRDATEEENEAWLREVKAEVEANNLMELLEEASTDEDELPPSLKPPRTEPNTARSASSVKSITSSRSASVNNFPLRTVKQKSKPVVESFKKSLLRTTSTKKSVRSGVTSEKSTRKIGGKPVNPLSGPASVQPSSRNIKAASPKDYDMDFDFHITKPGDEKKNK